jgi:hypothetical protein
VSFSSTFYKQLLCQYSFAKNLQTQSVGRGKAEKYLLYEKAACKMLVKLTTGAIFSTTLPKS